MRELMSPPIPFPSPDQIKSKILLESVRLFALRGYHAVSAKDIAAAANLRPNVLYHYFPSKLSIMESIMLSTEELILGFYDMLDRLTNEATSFSEIVSNIFMESKTEVNPSSHYAIHCGMLHQFSLECCRHLYYDIYFMEGHATMKRQLQTAIQRGLVAPFDFAEVATLITNCFVTLNTLTVGHLNGYFQDFDSAIWYERQINHVLRVTGALDE